MKKTQPPSQVLCPPMDEVVRALGVLDNQFLRVYQLLYFNKLTNPDGSPLLVKRDYRNGRPGIYIKISHQFRNSLWFFCYGTESDEEILRKANMLLVGGGDEKPFDNACCCHAKRIPCVCYVAMKCELHGETHIGTHD